MSRNVITSLFGISRKCYYTLLNSHHHISQFFSVWVIASLNIENMKNSDFESLLQIYILALTHVWHDQIRLWCVLCSGSGACSRGTQPSRRRAPWTRLSMRFEWRRKRREKKKREKKDQLMMKRHEAGSGLESRHRVDPLMWSRSRYAGVPVLRSAPPLFVTETRAGFRVFPLNEAAAPEGDSFGTTRWWPGSVLMLRFLCRICAVRVYFPAGLNHLLFAGWCCGSQWSQTDGAHLFFISSSASSAHSSPAGCVRVRTTLMGLFQLESSFILFYYSWYLAVGSSGRVPPLSLCGADLSVSGPC